MEFACGDQHAHRRRQCLYHAPVRASLRSRAIHPTGSTTRSHGIPRGHHVRTQAFQPRDIFVVSQLHAAIDVVKIYSLYLSALHPVSLSLWQPAHRPKKSCHFRFRSVVRTRSHELESRRFHGASQRLPALTFKHVFQPLCLCGLVAPQDHARAFNGPVNDRGGV